MYILCGITDVLDGYLARKYHLQSELGAKYDSIGDVIFFVVVGILCLRYLLFPIWMLVILMLVLGIRLLSLTIGYRKYYQLVTFHTYANKVTGLIVFILPMLTQVHNLSIVYIIMGSIAMYSSLEELLIQIRSTEIHRDIPSIFHYYKRK
jgi:CDP-diacylglycerol--glycerol-3-phosphate 3-phosphatidyltransferase